MILSETLFLEANCENCQSREYMEHESGFYVCVDCSVVSHMRHGLALEYKDLNTKGLKFKRKNVEENNEDQVDLNNFETNMNTMNNTCANSEFNDSFSSRITKAEIEHKPLSEVLLEHQNIFFVIFKSIFYYQFCQWRDMKKLSLDKDKHCDNFLNRFCSMENPDYGYFDNIDNLDIFDNIENHHKFYNNNEGLNENYKNKMKIFFENLQKDEKNIEKNSKFPDVYFFIKTNYNNLLSLAKEKWMNFIKLEYDNQIRKRPPKFRKRGLRSRRNTEDECSKIHLNSNFSGNNNNQHNFQYSNNLQNTLNNGQRYREKRPSINEELKQRRIKSKNIMQMEAYKNARLKNKDKMKKFIEEHDQVLATLKDSQEYIKLNTGIHIDETVSFKNILILAELFNIKINENATYEDVIHSFFITKELNYMSLYSEKIYDENKSNLNSDNFLTILYECFNSKINSFNKDYPIMIYELITLYKKINFKNVHAQKIKFLKYISKEKILKSFEKTYAPADFYYNIIDYISSKILRLPIFFSNFSKKIYKICENSIMKNLNYVDNYQAFSIGIIILSLRHFYGMNDLPYLIDVKKSFDNGLLKYSELGIFEGKVEEIFKIFEEIAKNDKLFMFYNELPSILQIIKNLVCLIKNDQNSTSLWEGTDFKKYSSLEYKEKFFKYNNKVLFPKLENNSCVRNITELEKRITGKFTPLDDDKVSNLKFNNEEYANLKENKFTEKGENSNSQINGKISFDVRFSDKFKSKISQKLNKTNNKYQTNKINNLKNLNEFLKEEVDFYRKTLKSYKTSNKIAIPLPCDTIIKYNKKAFKFDGVKPPVTELILYYLFSKYFKIEVQTLRKTIKILEKVIEQTLK